jgi:ATP-binding cassette subfamily C protein
VLGALTYVSLALQPALHSLVRGLGGSGLWLLVTLRRLTEAAEVPAAERAPGWYAGPAHHPGGPVLELAGVTFAHGAHAEPVLRHFDLVVPAGDHLAVVGPSGVGKSTLGGIAAGLLTPQFGQVLLGEVPLGAWDPAGLARHRVLIPQESYVFTGTVAENLTYLRPDATPADLDAAVTAVGAHALVERLGGLDAEFSATALSAGERQLITLARAYLSPATLVILDEATCHLDPAADARVEEAFAARPGALVVMAHRISSALRAQRVLVLDGCQPQLGTHDELLRTSALYRDLVGHWHPADRTHPARV